MHETGPDEALGCLHRKERFSGGHCSAAAAQRAKRWSHNGQKRKVAQMAQMADSTIPQMMETKGFISPHASTLAGRIAGSPSRPSPGQSRPASPTL